MVGNSFVWQSVRASGQLGTAARRLRSQGMGSRSHPRRVENGFWERRVPSVGPSVSASNRCRRARANFSLIERDGDMRGEPASWMGAKGTLARTYGSAPFGSWWIHVAREQWATAIARRWGRSVSAVSQQ
jgi:hypothetical protein